MTRCPMCLQELPDSIPPLAPRELDLVAEWWIRQNVRLAAEAIGVSTQTAKNMLLRARRRSRVADNDRLVAAHFEEVRKRMAERTSHKVTSEAA